MVVETNTEGDFTLGATAELWQRPFALEFYPTSDSFGLYDVTPDGQRFVMIDASESDPPPIELVLVQNWAEELKRLVPVDK